MTTCRDRSVAVASLALSLGVHAAALGALALLSEEPAMLPSHAGSGAYRVSLVAWAEPGADPGGEPAAGPLDRPVLASAEPPAPAPSREVRRRKAAPAPTPRPEAARSEQTAGTVEASTVAEPSMPPAIARGNGLEPPRVGSSLGARLDDAGPGAAPGGRHAGGALSRAARPASVIQPRYPRAARERGDEAEVIVEAWVAASGRVERARVRASAGPEFDLAALEAVQAARFHPALRGGEPVESRVAMRVHFELER